MLRPLCLCVKALLAEQKLGEAAAGGLRCARSLLEKLRNAGPARVAAHQSPVTYWLPPTLPSSSRACSHRSTWSLCQLALALLLEQRKAGLSVASGGQMLLGFLKYYGRVFDLAVGAARGLGL